MKRCWFGGIMLLVLLVCALVTQCAMEKCHEPMARDLEEAAQAALSDDWELADALMGRAAVRWQRYWRFCAAVADHEPMEDIDGLFAQLEVHCGTRDAAAAATVCRELASRVEDMSEAHALKWWNLL